MDVDCISRNVYLVRINGKRRVVEKREDSISHHWILSVPIYIVTMRDRQEK